MSSVADLDITVRRLRAAGEPTRLRLLALLRCGELTVGELCQVLEQSQPRTSRHLRLLSDAGLLEHYRELQQVYYRVPVSGAGRLASERLLQFIAPDCAVLGRDREAAGRVRAARAAPAASMLSGAFARALQDLLGPRVGALLDIGTGTGAVLEALCGQATYALGIDHSAPALRAARNRLHGAGSSHCEFRRADPTQLPVGRSTFDTVVLNRMLRRDDAPRLVREAARVMRAHGRLVVLELEAHEDAHTDADRLGQWPLQQWMHEAGLAIERSATVEGESDRLAVVIARHRADGAVRE